MPLPTNTNGPKDPRDRSPQQDIEQAPAQRPQNLPAAPGGLPTPPPARPRTPTPAPPMPPEEEDIFEQIPVQDVEDEDFSSYLEPDPEPEPEPVRRPARPAPRMDKPIERRPEPEPTPQRRDEYQVARDEHYADPVDEEESDFIDPKKKKIKPFGGAKSKKRDQKASDSVARRYDSREDRRTKARVVQVAAIVALVGVVGFGGYNALNPPVGVTAEEVNAAIEASRIADNFPQDRGAAFAEDFLNTYLTYDASNSNSQELLSYYYSGVIGGTGGESTASYNNVSQNVVAPPKSFKFTPITATSAAFEVGALVQTFSPDLPSDPNRPTPPDERYKWVFYNVNVYYDETTDTMAVTPDSPTLIPNANFGASTDIPDEKLLGTGEVNQDLAEAVRASLYGYLEAFAVSTPTSHDLLDQYLIDGAESGPELVKGLGGRFELSGGADTAVQYKAYVVEGDPNLTKLDVEVAWRDLTVPAETGTLVYNSRYYIEMAKQANGQWLVTASAPKYYLEAPLGE